jgi:surface antigen
MKRPILTTIIALSLAAPAWAGGPYYGGSYYYRPAPVYGGGYRHYDGYRDRDGYRHHRRHDHDNSGALVGGLLLGGLVGYALSESNRPDYYVTTPAYPAPAYTVVPAPAPVVVQQAEVDPELGECVMTREYTTTVRIDGRQHRAFGTRCMKPNGTWVLGRPKLDPDEPLP